MLPEHLPAGFTFTQTALRTYQLCPYRFRLRYIERTPWPTFPPEPAAEEAMERGRRFHEWVQQHFLGLDVSGQVGVAGADLARWWQVFRTAGPDLAAYPRRYPEAGLSVPLGRYRLAARYDLLAVGAGMTRAIDWKTGRSLPPPAVLATDIQTRVYLYVLAAGRAAYSGDPALAPGALDLLYWHPQGPREALIAYSAAQRDQDRFFLEALVAEIAAQASGEMPRVEDEAACAACAYASLCGRPGGMSWEWEVEQDAPPEEVEGWLEG